MLDEFRTNLLEELRAGDGDFGGPTLQSYDLGGITVAEGDSIYVRIYPWVRSSSEGEGRYLLLQAMTIHGEAVGEVAVDDVPEAAHFVLYPSAPNPVATTTTLRYELDDAANVEIIVLNVLGQQVATLASGPAPAGPHSVTVDATGLPAGTYFVHMRAAGQAQTRPFVVVR